MGDYCTFEQVQAYGYQISADDETLVEAIITRASRLVDLAANRPEGYFSAVAAGATATARVFWGNGTNYLFITPLNPATEPTLTMPANFTEPPWRLFGPGLTPNLEFGPGDWVLMRLYGDNEATFGAINNDADGALFASGPVLPGTFRGWPEGVKVTITALWGWEATPAAIQEATIETVIALWRDRDPAHLRAVALAETSQVVDPMPRRAKEICERFRAPRLFF
ncbi:MAG: hypothetical protein E6R03_02180 [Hyphomicrobiaceae bacterium]|nr:MAG: hypothetical protein E6R03_02180 [Hyphomicrobiaceae bacterium]